MVQQAASMDHHMAHDSHMDMSSDEHAAMAMQHGGPCSHGAMQCNELQRLRLA